MKNLFIICFTIATLFSSYNAASQLPECTLSIGGKDTEVLTKVFQMNEEQISKMEQWIGALQTQNKLVEDQIKTLLDTHPQSNQEELEQLAGKYKLLKDQMLATSKNYDQKLLGLFNEKQYQRYVELCTEALRKPLTAIGGEQPIALPEKPE